MALYSAPMITFVNKMDIHIMLLSWVMPMTGTRREVWMHKRNPVKLDGACMCVWKYRNVCIYKWNCQSIRICILMLHFNQYINLYWILKLQKVQILTTEHSSVCCDLLICYVFCWHQHCPIFSRVFPDLRFVRDSWKSFSEESFSFVL